jgi:hypothetical protein
MPAVLPYLVMLLFVPLCFFVMAFIVNPPLRDDAIYARCTQPPVQPVDLRSYFAIKRHALTDEGLTAHRQEILKQLAEFYAPSITHVKNSAKDPVLGGGMVDLLTSLSTLEEASPIVSVNVEESGLPEDGKRGEREDWLRDEFAKGVNEVFGQVSPPVQPLPGMEFVVPPPPVGHELVDWIKKDPDMPEALIDIRYTYIRVGDGYRVSVKVTIRTEADKPPVATHDFVLDDTYQDAAVTTTGGEAQLALKKALVEKMVGPFGKKNP